MYFALVINFLLEAGAFRFYMKGNPLFISICSIQSRRNNEKLLANIPAAMAVA